PTTTRARLTSISESARTTKRSKNQKWSSKEISGTTPINCPGRKARSSTCEIRTNSSRRRNGSRVSRSPPTVVNIGRCYRNLSRPKYISSGAVTLSSRFSMATARPRASQETFWRWSDLAELAESLREGGHGQAARKAISTKRRSDEQCTGSGRHAQGRIYSVGRWQAEKLERKRPTFCGLGDVSRQGIARRSEPAVCVAIQQLGRAVDPPLGRWRQNLAPARNAARRTASAGPAESCKQQVRLRRVCRNRQAADHPPVLRRHATS